MWCAIWTILFWFCLLFIAGFIAGAYNPQDPAAAGARAGELYGNMLLLLSFCISVLLTIKGKLPGTKKPK
jgi:ABC-type multidrug transport system permease subunit